MNALNEEETRVMLEHMFPERPYLNFQEFSAKLRVGAVDNDRMGN